MKRGAIPARPLRPLPALLLFLPLALPAALIAFAAGALGCLAALLASVAGWLLDAFEKAARESEQHRSMITEFRDEKFLIVPGRASLHDWFARRVRDSASGATAVRDLFDDYEDWCRRRNDLPVARPAFNNFLRDRGLLLRKGANGVRYALLVRLPDTADC